MCSSDTHSRRHPPVQQAAPLRLWGLPEDLLAVVLAHVSDVGAQCRLIQTSRHLRAAASTNTAWFGSFQRVWGSAMMHAVLDSIPPAHAPLGALTATGGAAPPPLLTSGPAATAEAGGLPHSSEEPDTFVSLQGVRVRAPKWMLAPARFSSDHQRIFSDCLDRWRLVPSLCTAFSCLDRLFTCHFASEPEKCLLKMREGLLEDEVRGQAANFIFWITRDRARDQATVCALRKLSVRILTHKARNLPEEEGERSRDVRQRYIRNFDTAGESLIDATRHFIARITMPSEANRTCRIMWDFAGHYRQNLPVSHALYGQSHDVVYLLLWSMLVLNADAHNPQVQRKMLVHEWVNNTMQAIDGVAEKQRAQGVESPPIDSVMLQEMYYNVTRHPILAVVDIKASCRRSLNKITDGRGEAGVGALGDMLTRAVGAVKSSMTSWGFA